MTRTALLTSKCFDKICRTCLSDIKGECFISVFKTYLGDKIIKDVLQLCASIQIEETDHLPKNICNNCLIKLISLNTFIEQCQESDNLLKSIVSSQSISSEIKIDEAGSIVEIIVATSDSSDEENSTSKDFNVEKEKKCEDKHKGLKKREKNDYCCRSCSVAFDSVEELKIHQRENNHYYRAKNYCCSFCNKAFVSRDHLNRHIRTHTKEKPYQCNICGMNFSMVQNLRRHEKLHTGERPYKCEDCGKGFIQSASLRNHKKSANSACAEYSNYTKNKEDTVCTVRLHCEYCGKSFKRHTPYNLHLKRHLTKTEEKEEEKSYNESDDRVYVCDICKKRYKSKSILKTHQLTHGEKKFLCSECGKGFVTKSALESHQKVHTKEKPHTCGICNKSFAYTGSFDTHMLLHTGEKKYVCKICSKSFTQGTHLKYHLRIHSGERPYSCNFCGKSFAVKGNLTVHIRTHTGETPYSCPVCGKGFRDSGSMKKHRRQHREVMGNVVTQTISEIQEEQLEEAS